MGFSSLKVFTFGFVLCITACAPVQILNTITPNSAYSRFKNISYGDLERQKLDVYTADNPKPGAPVIVFVHGGSWMNGSKKIYKFVGDGFAKEGYDVVIPNYRLYPEASYPVMIEDTAKAIAATQVRYPDRDLVLMGHSAGAYNILMTALVPKYLKAKGVELCDRIAGVVSLAGPSNVLFASAEPYSSIFPSSVWTEGSPSLNVTKPAPAIFLGHGEDDQTVELEHSQMLAEKILARGGVAVLKTYESMSHTDPVKVLSRHFDGKVTLKADIIDFIDGLPSEGSFCR